MRRIFLYNIICFFLLIISINVAQSQVSAGLLYGGDNNESGLSLTNTSDGGIILAGNTRSYGSGCNDIYIIKLNSYYQTVWTKTIGYGNQDIARSIIEVDDGYIICGESWSTNNGPPGIYMSKIDMNGNIVFQKSYGLSPLDNCFDVINTSTNNLLLVGYTRSIDVFGGVYLIMTNPQGEVIWDQIYGFQYDEYAMEAIEDEDGNFMIIGSKDGFFDDVHANFKTHDADIWLLKIDSNGNELGSYTYGLDGHDFGYSIVPDNDGYYLFGSTQSYGMGSFDMFLSKTDNQGNELWKESFGGIEFDYGISMSKNEFGDLYLLGTSKSFGQQGSPDILVIKTNSLGEEQWSITIGDNFSDYGFQIITTEDNGCALVGSTQTSEDGDTDIVFVKISPEGEIESFSGLNELITSSNILIPNPVISEATVMIPDSNGNYLLEIYNTLGMSVGNYKITTSNTVINLEYLRSGIYVYALTDLDDNKKITGKVLKN